MYKQLKVLKKIQKLLMTLDSQEWANDAKHFQGWKYMTGHQFIMHFRKACVEVGLVFRAEVLESEYIPILQTLASQATPSYMNLIRVTMLFELIDPDSGEYFSYVSTGEGADNMDKAGNKAKTVALKYFIRDNFLVGEAPEADDFDASGKKSSPLKRVGSTTEITSKANNTQLKVIKNQLKEYKELGGKNEYIKEAVGKINDLSSPEAEELMKALREKIKELE